jgi:hypothetical protein
MGEPRINKHPAFRGLGTNTELTQNKQANHCPKQSAGNTFRAHWLALSK